MPSSPGSAPPPTRRWTRHLVYRTERTRTTWTFRVALVVLVVTLAWIGRGWWIRAIASSLVCTADRARSDAILVENFDPDYLLFERARQLRGAGLAPRVLVPTYTDHGTGRANAVALGFAEVMARIARLGPFDTVPFEEAEPISLTAARDILGFLQREGIKSVIVVSPLFRSQRSALVYDAVLRPAGIAVTCDPVAGTRGPDNWGDTWHGIQDVGEQWVKLQYYRWYVLVFRNPPPQALSRCSRCRQCRAAWRALPDRPGHSSVTASPYARISAALRMT